ncbi:hypothetical protein ALC53_00856 [Atta colombica]|uniref:Uncharacterized protein n=1 Tax=Atta colombica TaxID=520822 RepID=A0A195BWR4_9HYME|nr:hypothetical protein ALC53_00856 [Atta colombica]
MEWGLASVSGRRDPARGPVRQREPEWSDENGTHHRSTRLRRCDIDPGRHNLATDGGSGDGDGLDDGAAVVAAPRRRSLISTWPNIARYHSRFWTGELRDDRCVFPVFRARAVIETTRKLGNANPGLPNSPCYPTETHSSFRVGKVNKCRGGKRLASSKPVRSFALEHGTRYPMVLMLRNTLLIGFQTPACVYIYTWNDRLNKSDPDISLEFNPMNH